ncbi:hypothetical protein MRX96_026928 [Rhipicephalus microplus]
MLTRAFFKFTTVYGFLSVLIHLGVLQTSHREDSGKIMQPSGTVYRGPANFPPGVVPYALADMMRGILADYEADAALFRRRPETTRHRHIVMLINKAGWSVDPTRAGGFERPAATDSATFNRVDRRTSTLPQAQHIHGFFRGPRMKEIGRPPTVREVFEHELEMIQHIDRDGCMLRLCCEIGGGPERYLEYHIRVVMFLRDPHKMVGDSSALPWRHDAAFRKGSSSKETA